MTPPHLHGKTALVTGARRGIGKAMAVALAEAGADIIGVSAQLEPEDSEVGRNVEAVGRTFRSYECDLADRAALYRFLDSLRRDVPVVDILVNNAGVILRSPAADHSDADWDRGRATPGSTGRPEVARAASFSAEPVRASCSAHPSRSSRSQH